MRIPIINGVYTDQSLDVRTSYPVNMVPVMGDNGVSPGYMRPADGIVEFSSDTPGVDRGGINWNGTLYRVLGTKLCKVSESGYITVIGDVGGVGPVTFDYSFDQLAVVSNKRLYYTNGVTITQVTDPDLGDVLDAIWIDGYFMTTDGEFLVVTELNDPTQVNPLKYGSSEIDPDPIIGLIKLRNEAYALNRYTIEAFDNIGGTGFPFRRIDGAQINKGVVGAHAACHFLDALAFIGGGKDEPPSVYVGANANADRIATREVDLILGQYTEEQLAQVVINQRTDKGNTQLWVNLPDKTLVYDAIASKASQEHIWYILSSALTGFSKYRGTFPTYCYDRWIVGDSDGNRLGSLDPKVSTHYGNKIGWEFGTTIVYNDGKGAIFHELELVLLSGRVPVGANPSVWTSYSHDGVKWSQERSSKVGTSGNTTKRVRWLGCGNMTHYRIQKFRGTSDAYVSVLRLEARLEPLNN